MAKRLGGSIDDPLVIGTRSVFDSGHIYLPNQIATFVIVGR